MSVSFISEVWEIKDYFIPYMSIDAMSSGSLIQVTAVTFPTPASGKLRKKMNKSYSRVSRVLPKNNSRHDGRVWFGRGLWPHQSFLPPSFPTSKKSLCWTLVGPTCLKYTGENTGLSCHWILHEIYIFSLSPATHPRVCLHIIFSSGKRAKWYV